MSARYPPILLELDWVYRRETCAFIERAVWQTDESMRRGLTETSPTHLASCYDFPPKLFVVRKKDGHHLSHLNA